MKKVSLTADVLENLYAHNILPRYNCPPPNGGKYGWLEEDMELTFRQHVTIEENVGLYGGRYKPFRGGRPSHGFATVGSFSSCASPLPEGLTVGRYCGISTGLRFIDSAHPLDTLTSSGSMFRPHNHLYKRVITPAVRGHAQQFQNTPSRYPIIGHDVWIGANVTMAPHVTVGTGAVIATGTMVTKNIPPYAIVGGNPGRIIRYRFPDELIERLLAAEWWNHEPAEVFATDPRQVTDILDRLESGAIAKFRPRAIVLGE